MESDAGQVRNEPIVSNRHELEYPWTQILVFCNSENNDRGSYRSSESVAAFATRSDQGI